MAERMAAAGRATPVARRHRARGLRRPVPDLAGVAAAAGLDPRVDWLPIAPAAHYLSGGVVTDLDGASALPGLWAAGEVACTGVHGANRLASNSLLEGMVFGARLAEAIAAGRDGPGADRASCAPAWLAGRAAGRRSAAVDIAGLAAPSSARPPARSTGSSAGADVDQDPGPAAAGHDRRRGRAPVTRRRWRAAAEAVVADVAAAARGLAGAGRAAGELANLVTVASALLRGRRRPGGDPGGPRPRRLPGGPARVAPPPRPRTACRPADSVRRAGDVAPGSSPVTSGARRSAAPGRPRGGRPGPRRGRPAPRGPHRLARARPPPRRRPASWPAADGVVAGRLCALEAFAQVDPALAVDWRARRRHRGGWPGSVVAEVSGPLRSILTAERTALNFLCHLSGVATADPRASSTPWRAANPATRVLDTRKTTPGLRALEKAAVRAGGGCNHRGGLSDAVLVKDNHLGRLGIADAVALARRWWPGRMVEVECDRARAGGRGRRRRRVGRAPRQHDPVAGGRVRGHRAGAAPPGAGTVLVEVSGGVTLDSAPAYAAAGADLISVGAITHSAPVLDLGLDLVED